MSTFVGKCKRCKVAARFSAEVTTRRFDRGYGRVGYDVQVAAPWGNEKANDRGDVYVRCLCGGTAIFSRVIGRLSEHKCGAKCRNSTSGICECSCKGANHGCSYSVAS